MNFESSRDHALRLAVRVVIASEAVLFASLLAARGEVRAVPAPGLIAVAAVVGAALFAGGAALAKAMRRTETRQPVAAARLLVLGGALGIAALALELAASRATGRRDMLSTAIVGLHAAQVAAAIALTAWVLALVRCGRVHRGHHDILRLVGTYWYFVAGVWVFVWPLLATTT